MIPHIVETDQIPAANGYVFAAETAGEKFAGPALGGLIFTVLQSLPFIGDAVSFLASAILLRSAVPPAASHGPTKPEHGVLHDVWTGLRWFLANGRLRILAVVVTTFAFCQSMVFAILALFATRTLGLDSGGYGLMLAAAAVGDIAASFLAGRVHHRLGPFRTIVAAGLVSGAAYLIIGSDKQVIVTTVALLLEAAAVTLGNVATLSARHRLIPAERFGLINNAFRMCVMGVVPAGSIFGGEMADAFGLTATFLVAGVIQVAVLLVIALPLRSTFGARAESTPETVVDNPAPAPAPAPDQEPGAGAEPGTADVS